MLRYLVCVLMTMLFAGAAQATSFNGGAVTIGGCSRSGTTYTCSTIFANDNDIADIASGYTVLVNGSVIPSWKQGITMAGSARLEATGDIDLTKTEQKNYSTDGATIKAGGNFKIGGNRETISANIIAATVDVVGEAAKITGTISATGNINLAGKTEITGAVSGNSITTGSNTVIGGSLTIAGNIQLGSSTSVSGAVSSASITADADVKLGSTLVVTGAIKLESRVEVTGAVSGDSIVTNSDVILRSTLAIRGAINLSSGNIVTGKVTGASIKTNSNTSLNGSLKVDGLAELGSSIIVLGGIRANEVTTVSPVKNISGGIIADKAITIASGSTVSGDLTAPTITFDSSNSTLTGNINASTLLTMGSRTNVIGNIVAAKVNTTDGVTINGNAAVNSIYLGGNSTVSKVITCTGPGAVMCSCVTKPDWYNYNPTCAAAPPAGAHHFQITHSGSALTCQPQTVTVTACANAGCATPHFTGSSTVTLQPGGKSFTFTGTTSTATVEQTTVGPANLAATGTTDTVCVNSSNSAATDQCVMTFEDTGLLVTVDNHIAADTANVRIQALTATSTKQSCVPLVAGKSADINLSCGFLNPANANANGNARVAIKEGANLSCGSSAAKVNLSFDNAGVASTTLTYPEVGEVSLTAAYAGPGGYTAKGSGKFIAAPARFNIEATGPGVSGKKIGAGTLVDESSAAFAKTGEAFSLKISAVNSKGDVTTNFGKEATPENMKVAIPVVDNPVSAGNLGVITTAAWSVISNGVSNTSAWSFNDVGIIRIDVSLNSGAGYFGLNGENFKTKGSQKIGRFTPDHFDTSLPILATPNGARTPDMVPAGQIAGMTMPCKATATSTTLLSPCDPVFIYSHQPFYVIVKAYNSSNNLTSNYQGALAKPITLSAATTLGGTTLVDSNVGAMGGTIANIAPGFKFLNGVGKVDDPNYTVPDNLSMPTFRFNTLPSASTGSTPTRFFVRAVDTDGTTSQRATNAIETAVTAVSGRLLVPNVAGSPSSSMPITVQAQFYDGNRGFVFNPMYNAPVKSLADYLRFDRCEKGLASNNANACTAAAQLQLVAPGSAAVKDGKAGFRLVPPAQAGTGSVDLTLRKPCPLTPACNVDPHWINYLPSTTGKLTFGIYRSGPVIYTREVY